jgi:hypothetical protein
MRGGQLNRMDLSTQREQNALRIQPVRSPCSPWQEMLLLARKKPGRAALAVTS